ncbi:transposase [Streptomyces sp. WAC06614]|uniref:transposase n=1 Tax=Streptomyces sp. WAC06614 TaxID=2487416 RepID=UPI00163BCAE5
MSPYSVVHSEEYADSHGEYHESGAHHSVGGEIRGQWCRRDDELWARIEPLLPAWPERSPGPRPVDDQRCLQGILFVLYTGIPWQQAVAARVGLRLRADLLAQARPLAAGWSVRGPAPLTPGRGERGRTIDWTCACVDASHVRAKKGARPPARPRSTAARPAANTT